MATVPDGQPVSIGTGPVGSGVSEPVTRVGVTVGPGAPGEPETEPCDAQDTTASDGSTMAAASRAASPLGRPITDYRSVMAGVYHTCDADQ